MMFRGYDCEFVGGFDVNVHRPCGHIERINVRTLARARNLHHCKTCVTLARQDADDYILDTWEHMAFGGVQIDGPTHNFFVVPAWELKTGHRAERHKDCTRERCFICEGGLTCCTICGALEGALLPTCPGRMLTYEEHEDNYKEYCDGTGPFAQ